MNIECPNNSCPQIKASVKRGLYFRKSDSKYIQRYQCQSCRRGFSSASRSINYKQKKRRLNPIIYKMYVSCSSQRRIARTLRINLKTVARKIVFLSNLCAIENRDYIRSLDIAEVQFDEMESFEHTKLKPVSIPIIVERGSRKILGIDVCEMPSKGLLSKRSVKKYGRRRDERTRCLDEVLAILRNKSLKLIESDECPRYIKLVKKHFQQVRYKQYKGRRGCVVGQGELKAGGYDPLFSLNHTCAMVRANVNRLVRRTWCTTKSRESLRRHLEIYMHYHNFHLT